jgi:hypothetical protein
MLIACWSAKGGTGTTVVAAALAGLLSRRAPGGAVIADLAGDIPAAIGLAAPVDAGLSDWLGADIDAAAGLALLEVPVRPGLVLLPRGDGELGPPARAEVLAAILASDPRPVVVDCGVVAAGSSPTLGAGVSGPLGFHIACVATESLLVLRPCYLALRRALNAPVRPSGVILLTERERALSALDVEEVLGVPVRAQVAVDPDVARAVDAGTLLDRVPSTLARGLRAAV